MEAKSRRVTKSQVMRESLETALDANASGRQPSCFDLSSDLAGSISGLPKDLATNPKYMDDFGGELSGFSPIEAPGAPLSQYVIEGR